MEESGDSNSNLTLKVNIRFDPKDLFIKTFKDADPGPDADRDADPDAEGEVDHIADTRRRRQRRRTPQREPRHRRSPEVKTDAGAKG